MPILERLQAPFPAYVGKHILSMWIGLMLLREVSINGLSKSKTILNFNFLLWITLWITLWKSCGKVPLPCG